MNTKLWMPIVLGAVGCSLVACGGAPVREEPEPEPYVDNTPTAVVVDECTEEWVHMPVHIGFPTGGTEIDAQNRRILEEIVRTARSRDDIRRVRVEGHTDTCGSDANNHALSEQRAMAVANELVVMGVPRELLETVGYGSTQLIANEDCERASDYLSTAANRRVEFSILACREGTSGGY